jgi:hypothetical protein
MVCWVVSCFSRFPTNAPLQLWSESLRPHGVRKDKGIPISFQILLAENHRKSVPCMGNSRWIRHKGLRNATSTQAAEQIPTSSTCYTANAPTDPHAKKTTGVPMLLCCFMVSSAVLQVHLSPGIKLRFCQNICTAWIDMTWADFSRGASRRPQLWSFWMGSPARPLWAPSSLVLCDGRGTWHGTGSGCKNEPENCHDMSWLEAKTHTRTNINIGTAWSRSWYFSGTNIY